MEVQRTQVSLKTILFVKIKREIETEMLRW